MNKFFSLSSAVLLCSMSTMCFTSCSDDGNDINGANSQSEQVMAIESLTKDYVKNVVYPTYTDLANETEKLYDQLYAAKEAFRAGTLTQSNIDEICETFKTARQSWEETEAFLYGPATQFGIDPHIDTWPLDIDALAISLSNAEQVDKLDGNTEDEMKDAISYASGKLGIELLGFHGIEFVIFRNGANRTVADLKANEIDKAFAGKTVTGEQELIYATAVAGDLRDKCYQLEVSWRGEEASQAHRERIEECEFETLVTNNFYYGDNMMNATKSGSTYATWQETLVTILDAGCSNIANEVANTKIGTAYSGSTNDDLNYIESPYSKRSFIDFYDNIISVKNSLYGGVNLSTPTTNSIMAFIQKYNVSLYTDLNTSLNEAMQSLVECQNSGVPFVDNKKATYVKNAMDKINDFNDNLSKAANWAATIE